MKKQTPFGLWSSPISSRSLACEMRLSELAWAGDGATLVWLEGRDGRGVLVARRPGDAARDLNDELSIGGGVGYGGGEFTIHEGTVFAAAKDGRLYRIALDHGEPRPLTPTFGKVASPAVSSDGKWVAYVHCDGKNDVIGAVDTLGLSWPVKLVHGADFYMQPTWAPPSQEAGAVGKSRLAWVAWDHPQMPWNGARLETAIVEFGARGPVLGDVECWAGSHDVSVLQPTFSPDGQYLAYASDESGWWQIYLRDLSTGQIRQISKGEAEHGGPAWVQGVRVFAWLPDSKALIAVKNERGIESLVRYSIDGGEATPVPALGEYQAISQPAISRDGQLAFLGSSSRVPARVVRVSDDQTPRVERRASSERVPADELSKMQPVSWTSGTPGVEVYGNYYPPISATHTCSGKPPALIMIHGGPTTQRGARYESRNQFFATRGFAVLDVNYRGSTGYGRTYMEALFGQWGVADVEDAVSGASFLAEAGLAHADKIVIMGGSAGGYTVLQAVTSHPGTFAAGVCLYGIADLFTLQMGTHKFEAHYNDTLIGPLPEATDLYRERSPIFRADRICDPVAVYHGAQDQVVPIDQAEAIVSSLKSRGVPHLYHVYEDEGHGWRKSANIEHFHDSLLEFLIKYVVYT